MQDTINSETPRLCNVADISLMLGLSKSEIYLMTKKLAVFPKATNLCRRNRKWLVSDIKTFILNSANQKTN